MYAGVWRRFFAAVIDGFLYSVLYLLWLIILFPQKGLDLYESFLGMLHEGHLLWFMFQYILFPIAALWLYNTLFECSSMQGTLGKALLGIKVTNARGDRLSFLRASARCFCKLVISPLSVVGFFMAFLTKKKQALHDILAGTLVVEGAYTKVDKNKDIEVQLLKVLDEGRINTYDELLQRKKELMGIQNKKAI